MQDGPYWIAFSRINGVGAARARRLEAHFGSLESAWKADAFELKAAGLDDRSVGALIGARRGIDPVAELEKLSASGVKAVALPDTAYPWRLREIQNPPMVLYIRGELTEADEWAVGIVGTRSATIYGRDVTARLAGDLARNGVT
ncbi:MAG: DNA-processing protein DprA, partial [Chloroflexota bacterium]|nr:DNA-processing protein DprA [Chloroflexota bacterium]